MGNINDYAKTVGFGSGTNRTKFNEDGSMVFEGDATVWDDVIGSLIAKKLTAVTGKVDYNWDEITITFEPNGDIDTEADVLFFNVQIPHAQRVNSPLDLHIHWEQDSAVDRDLEIHYRIQHNGQLKTTTWTEATVSLLDDTKFTYTSGTLNQISDLIHIPSTGIGISAVVQFKIARTDNNAGDLEATFIDIHVEKDTIGSRSEYVK